MLEKKNFKVVPVIDPEFDGMGSERPMKFYVIEGACKKCGIEPNSLVIYEFKPNNKVPSQSLFKTQCLCCGHKDIHYSGSVST